MTVINLQNQTPHTERKMFFDEGVDIQRYDIVKYDWAERWTDKGLGNFWRPQEVDLTKDKRDYAELDFAQKFIFDSNLKRQIVLDTVQGRAPALAFLPIVSLPEVEAAILKWTFDESIHSRSYTHILRNVHDNPSEIFDNILSIKEIADLAKDISVHYDVLIGYNNVPKSIPGFGSYNHKKALWRAMFAVNALEGIRFYVSFACSWAFAQVLGKMEGNAKVIKLICRDENEHLKYTQMVLRTLPKEDPDFAKIKVELAEEMNDLFMNVVNQEKEWAKYLFQHGDMLGLDERVCCDLVDWLADKRMGAIGMSYSGNVPKDHPLPWINSWISGNSRQVAPQEAEIESYIIGVTEGGVDEEGLKNVKVGL